MSTLFSVKVSGFSDSELGRMIWRTNNLIKNKGVVPIGGVQRDIKSGNEKKQKAGKVLRVFRREAGAKTLLMIEVDIEEKWLDLWRKNKCRVICGYRMEENKLIVKDAILEKITLFVAG